MESGDWMEGLLTCLEMARPDEEVTSSTRARFPMAFIVAVKAFIDEVSNVFD